MPLRFEDLPAAVQAQIRREGSGTGSAERRRGSRKAAKDVPSRYRCVRCGAVLAGTYAAAERHVDAHGGGRIEWLPAVESETTTDPVSDGVSDDGR